MPRPLGSLLVATALLFGASVPARPQAASPDSGFDAVTVDLRLGSFGRVLPFDVPFWINGDMPGTFNRIEVKYRALARKNDSCADPARWAGAPTAVWQLPPAFAPAAGAASPATQSFRLTVDRPLDPERFYCFLFVPMIDPPRAVVDQAVAEAASEASDAARETHQGADYVADAWQRAQKKLIARLGAAQLQQAGEITPAPLSALSDEQQARLADEAQDVLDKKGEVRTVNQQFVDHSHQLDAAADAVQDQVGAESASRLAFQLRTLLDNVLETTPGIEGQGPQVTTEEVLSPEETDQLLASSREKLRLLEETFGATRLQQQVDRGDVPDAMLEQAWRVRELSQGQVKLAEQVDAVHGSLAAEQEEVRALLTEAIDGINLSGTTSSLSPSTQFNNYVSGDVGLLYGPEIEAVVPYVGVNFYFRPINKAAPVRGGLFSRKRVALTLGLTLTDGFVDEAKTREPLFASQALLVGGGIRLTPSLRLGAGALLFRKKDPNPLADDTSLGLSGYLSLTFDVNVVKLFGQVGAAVFPNAPGGGL